MPPNFVTLSADPLRLRFLERVGKGELWGNWVDGTVSTYSNWETGNWEFLPTSYINGYGYMWYGTNDNRWMFANVTLEGYNNIPGGETPTFIFSHFIPITIPRFLNLWLYCVID